MNSLEKKVTFSGGTNGRGVVFVGGDNGTVSVSVMPLKKVTKSYYPNITLQPHPEYEQRLSDLEEHDSNGIINGGIIM